MKSISVIFLALVFVVFIGDNALADLNDGLVAYYPFNGNANDESGNGNNGTVNGAMLTADRFGKEDSAYLFDGINDGIVINNGTSFSSEIFSIAAWIKPGTIDDNGRIISQDNGSSIRNWFLAYYGEYGYAHFGVFSGSEHLWTTTSNQISIDTWIHLVAIYDGVNAKIYMNGILEGTLSIPGGINHQSGEEIYIGRYALSESEPFFDGIIDDIRIYNRALTEIEIYSLYQKGGWSHTIAHWIFDEMEGDTLYDVSGNGHDGVISGATWTYGYSVGSLYFDELLDEVLVNHDETLNLGVEPFTIEAIVKTNGIAIDPSSSILTICSKYTGGYNVGFYMGINSSEYSVAEDRGKIYVYVNHNSTIGRVETMSNISVNDNKWHHIALVRDYTSDLYIDGILDTSITNDVFCDVNNSTNLKIGHHTITSGAHNNWTLNGFIDEIRISDTALSPEEFLEFKPKSIIAHWTFDEMEGDTLHDGSGNNHYGIIHGATWVKGNNNLGALKFNGSDDYVQISHNSNLETPDSITVEAIIKPGLTGGRIVNKDDQYASDPDRSYFLSVDKYSDELYAISWRVYSTPNVGGVQINYYTELDTGKWYHIAGAFDGNHLRIYFNKELAVDSTVSYVRNKGTSPLYIGRPNYGNMWFDGAIDEIRISDKALSPDEFVDFKIESDTISISVPECYTFYQDTVTIPITVNFPDNKHYDSAELIFTDYQSGLKFIDIDTSETMAGNAGWDYAFNEVGDSLIISWLAGANSISGNGVLFKLQFQAVGDICSFYPINIQKAVFNTGEDFIIVTNGGVHIQPIPAYGDVDENGIIQAHDAALILKHLVEIDTLYCQGLANADVTDDGTVSALDASIILQYGVELISDLPYDTSVNGSLAATGEFSMEEEIGTLGGLFEIPILIGNGNNIYSFEGRLEYDPECLIFSEFSLPSDKSNYQIQFNDEDGQIRWAGAGTSPDGTEGTFINACFSYYPSASIDHTVVYLRKIKINEENEKTSVGQTTVYSLVGISNQDELPNEYTLSQNYPNPFNPTTEIQYALPKVSNITITIFDINGRTIDQLVYQKQQAGYYSVLWDASRYSSGVYFYQIKADRFQQVRKMLLIK